MIPFPTSVKVVEKKDNRAVFEIEGLYPGYGVTIGNGLRRVLLSSLEGAAITQVRIKGVNHELSTIAGVMEDVMMIIINLKKLTFKSYAAEPQKVLLKVKGEKVVKGGDFDLPSQVEITNPEMPIATLTSAKSQIEMEVQIERGMGYQPVEMREDAKKEIGVMPVDAIYGPVRKVGFRVESMRVGKRTDFDRLLIEIETNGTISPEDALKESAEILMGHFSLLSKVFEKTVKEQEKKLPAKKKTAKKTAVKKTLSAKSKKPAKKTKK